MAKIKQFEAFTKMFVVAYKKKLGVFQYLFPLVSYEPSSTTSRYCVRLTIMSWMKH